MKQPPKRYDGLEPEAVARLRILATIAAFSVGATVLFALAALAFGGESFRHATFTGAIALIAAIYFRMELAVERSHADWKERRREEEGTP